MDMDNNIINKGIHLNKTQKIKLFVEFFILIILCVFFISRYDGLEKTFTSKEGLYNILYDIITEKLFFGSAIVLIISIIFININEKFKKIQYFLMGIIIVIYLLCVPCIKLIGYTTNEYNSQIGVNFIIITNIISDIITDETYDINVTNYKVTTSNVKWNYRGRTHNATSQYIKFDDYAKIPVTIKDQMIIDVLFEHNNTNTITLYKKSGLIKSINGKNINISMDEYMRLQQDIKKEKIHQILKNQIEQKGEELFQISVKSDGKIHRTELGYENELELYWILKKDGKIIQKIKADTPTCTFQNKGDTTSKYTMFIMGIFDGIEYNLSKEIPVFEFTVEN